MPPMPANLTRSSLWYMKCSTTRLRLALLKNSSKSAIGGRLYSQHRRSSFLTSYTRLSGSKGRCEKCGRPYNREPCVNGITARACHHLEYHMSVKRLVVAIVSCSKYSQPRTNLLLEVFVAFNTSWQGPGISLLTDVVTPFLRRGVPSVFALLVR